MNPTRFDTITKLFASRTTRRIAVAGGIGLAGARMVGGHALAQGATPTDQCPATTEAENMELIQRYIAAIDAGDPDAMLETLAPMMTQDAADFPSAASAEEVVTNISVLFDAFPDRHHEFTHLMAQDNFVVARVVATGTHEGEFQGIAPTGTPVTWDAVVFYRVECGRIAQAWTEADALGRLQQLGAVPAFSSSAVPGTPSTDEGAMPDTSSTPATCPSTTETDNVALVLRFYEEVLNRGRYDNLDDILAADFTHHRALAENTTGLQRRQALMEAYDDAFPDLAHSINLIVADGDLVAVRWTARGTHTGPFRDIAPTGNQATWSGNTIYRITCGRVAEQWSQRDNLALYQQLEVVEWPPAGTPST